MHAQLYGAEDRVAAAGGLGTALGAPPGFAWATTGAAGAQPVLLVSSRAGQLASNRAYVCTQLTVCVLLECILCCEQGLQPGLSQHTFTSSAGILNGMAGSSTSLPGAR